MAALTTSDILTRIMNELRLPGSNSVELAKVQAVLNMVYRDVLIAYDWWFLYKRGVLTTANDVTGTALVTNGSTGVTLSASVSTDLIRRSFVVDSDTTDSGAVYRIATHGGGTAVVLDAPFTGTTSAAVTYRVYEDALSLASDVGTVLHVSRFGYLHPMRPIGIDEMLDLKARERSVGKPDLWTMLDFQTTGDPTTVRRLVVHPYPDDTYRLEYHYRQTYNTELSGSTQPLIPDDYRQILVYGTLSRGYPIFLNDVQRGQYYTALFEQILAKMVARNREQEGYPRIEVLDVYRKFYSNPVRGRHMSLRSYFGRWPNEP